jgi:hypothetical protein
MPMIGMDVAREISDGSGVTVAVLDTGVAFENHYDPSPDPESTAFARAPDLASTTFVYPCRRQVHLSARTRTRTTTTVMART